MHIRAAVWLTNCVVTALLAPTTTAPPLCRRELLLQTLSSVTVVVPARVASAFTTADVHDTTTTEWPDDPRWVSLGLSGTKLPLRSLESAAQANTLGPIGLYPDPILRRTGSPVTKFGPAVETVANMLVNGMNGNAVTALHYGIDARIMVLRGPASPNPGAAPLVLVNPTVLARSSEDKMMPWREYCRVLPPKIEVDLLRDEVVEVAAQDVKGVPIRKALRGEAARAFQHEMDHLNGILIIDHAVSLDELPDRAVATLEGPYHAARQQLAFERRTYQGNEPLYW